jgi:hypothetical protein
MFIGFLKTHEFLENFKSFWEVSRTLRIWMNNVSGTMVSISFLVEFCMLRVFAGDLLPILELKGNSRISSL